jgi:curli biogenesis system outer membrane secretion channel CsgG
MRIIKTFIIMFLFVSTLQAFEKDKATSIYREKLIVADFKNQSEYKFLGKSLTDELSVLFAETKRFDIIEREKLADILKEQELQLSGIVNPEDAVSVGKLAGAKYIIFGSITGASVSKSVEKKTKTVTKKENGKKVTKKVKYYVTTWTAKVHLAARLIDIETGKVLLGKRVTGRASKSIKSDNKNDYVWIVENVTEELKGDKSNRKKA